MKDLRGIRLKVGTDCSGIEAPIQALRKFKIPYTHEFSSDIDKHAIESIKANYKPQRLYGDPEGKYPDGDIRHRDNSTLPKLDLYVAGFPCQGNSNMGKRKGMGDERGQSVFDACVDTIKHAQPELFILENVPGIKSVNNGVYWEYVLKTLNDIGGYNVDYMVLNSKDYGIPQNRKRVFIVGKRGIDLHINVPDKRPLINWRTLVEDIDVVDKMYKCMEDIYTKITDDVIVDANVLHHFKNFHKDYTPCMLARGGLWYVKKHRFLTAREYLNFQGFPKNFKQVVSNFQIKKQAGNSMTVNTIGRVIQANLKP